MPPPRSDPCPIEARNRALRLVTDDWWLFAIEQSLARCSSCFCWYGPYSHPNTFVNLTPECSYAFHQLNTTATSWSLVTMCAQLMHHWSWSFTFIRHLRIVTDENPSVPHGHRVPYSVDTFVFYSCSARVLSAHWWNKLSSNLTLIATSYNSHSSMLTEILRTKVKLSIENSSMPNSCSR